MGSQMPNDIYIVNGKVVTPFRIIHNGGVQVRGDRIIGVFEMGSVEIPLNQQIIDVKGCIVSPGLIDMHLHGGGGADVMDGQFHSLETIAATHAAGGVTSILPSTLTSSAKDLHKVLETFKHAGDMNGKGARILGLHLEGPYFAASQKGAQDGRYLKNPDPREYLSLFDNYPFIRRVSAAPELPGALELGRELRRRKILASIGHSDATYDEVIDAVGAGYSHITHLYSGMSGIKRVNCYRVAGIIESALLMDELTVEIIADGKHLPASLLKLIYKCKGAGRIALCSDALRATMLPEGEYISGSNGDGQKIHVEQGVAWLADRSAFAGSVATGNRLVRTMVELAEIPLREAIMMATETPARILEMDDRIGSLEAGKYADITVLKDDFSVVMTMVNGTTVYSSQTF